MKRRKRRSSKKICQTIHFQKRSQQRFGVILGKAERKVIIDDIQGNNYFCEFIERQRKMEEDKFTETKVIDILKDLGEIEGVIVAPDGRYLVNGEEYLKEGAKLVRIEDKPEPSETEK